MQMKARIAYCEKRTRMDKIENAEKINKNEQIINKKKILTIPSIGDDVEQVELPRTTEQRSYVERQCGCVRKLNIYLGSRKLISMYLSKAKENIHPFQDLYLLISSNIIYNNCKVGTT